jgi:hypothetical protein
MRLSHSMYLSSKVYLDLLVDALFCMAYLVELQQEKDVGLTPPWLYKYRAWDLWYEKLVHQSSPI